MKRGAQSFVFPANVPTAHRTLSDKMSAEQSVGIYAWNVPTAHRTLTAKLASEWSKKQVLFNALTADGAPEKLFM